MMTSPTTRLWLLGAPDPEMQAIERLLTEAGEAVTYATMTDGRRVHPGSAYQHRGTRVNPALAAGWDGEVYLVECDGLHLRDSVGVTVAEVEAGHPGRVVHSIDHHRPGDPGYGRPPAEYLRASSIGQVLMEMARLALLPSSWLVHAGEETGWDVPHHLLLTAAADHCLGAAYRGECPGVDPDELMRWRAESRAAHQGRAVADVMADIAAAQQTLRDAEDIYIDMGPMPGGETYFERLADMRRPEPIPELPEAAMRMGVGYISGPLSAPDGRRKICCSGTQQQVTAFLDSWAPDEGLVDIYGDPARGFAGGYLPD